MDIPEQTERDATLSVLAAAEQRRRKHTSDRDMAVYAARHRGATWDEIAAVLGVSRQAVAKMYGPGRQDRL
jgi:hypothetical protein